MIGVVAGMLLTACASPANEQATAGEHAAAEQTAHEMVVYRSPTCGCCSDWVSYMESHGYTATVEDVEDLAAVKAEHNVPRD